MGKEKRPTVLHQHLNVLKISKQHLADDIQSVFALLLSLFLAFFFEVLLKFLETRLHRDLIGQPDILTFSTNQLIFKVIYLQCQHLDDELDLPPPLLIFFLDSHQPQADYHTLIILLFEAVDELILTPFVLGKRGEEAGLEKQRIDIKEPLMYADRFLDGLIVECCPLADE